MMSDLIYLLTNKLYLYLFYPNKVKNFDIFIYRKNNNKINILGIIKKSNNNLINSINYKEKI